MTYKKKSAFTMAEVLISLLMICLATTAIGSALSATLKIDRARDINVAIKSQNISTVEYLRDAVRSSDDVWKLFDTYSCEILGYSAETTAKVLAVERGNVDALDASFIQSYSDATYNKNTSINGNSFGNGVTLSGAGSKVVINGSSMSNYMQAVIGIACEPGALGMYKITYNGASSTKNIMANVYDDNTSIEMLQLVSTSDIEIENLTNTPLYIVNTYFVQDSVVMGYEESDNIVPNLKDNAMNNSPTLFRVKVNTQIKGKKNGNTDLSDGLEGHYDKNNSVTTFIILKE